MQQLIRFLLDNPIIGLLVLGALFQMIGQTREKAAARGRAAQRTRRAAAPAQPKAAESGRPSEEEIAAEMRRILGMEPRPAPARAPAPAPAPRPAPRPVVRETAAEKPPEPL